MDEYVTCRECTQLLDDFLDANLDPETTRRLEEHLAECPPCVHFLNTYRSCSEMSHKLRDRPGRNSPQACRENQGIPEKGNEDDSRLSRFQSSLHSGLLTQQNVERPPSSIQPRG